MHICYLTLSPNTDRPTSPKLKPTASDIRQSTVSGKLIIIIMNVFLERLYMWNMLNCTEQGQILKYKAHSNKTLKTAGVQTVMLKHPAKQFKKSYGNILILFFRLGNLGDVGKAGSLHQFLLGLHKQFGPITSFWWGKQFAVSISSPDLFRQHQHLFDRPSIQLWLFL